MKAMYQYQYGRGFGGGKKKAGSQTDVSETQTAPEAESADATTERLFSGKQGGTGFVSGETGTQTVSATYSDEAISELLFMIEEEKLAGDLYEAFYDMYGLNIFANIAASEDQHFNALISQAEKIGLDVDQFVFEETGTYADAELQEMYDTLLAQGSESLTAALEVGVAIEEKDMVDIAIAAEDVAGTSLANVYENLLAGSANHLEAFQDVLFG